VPIDPDTLALDKEKGIRVRPEHLHLALREFAGIADHAMSKQFPLVIPGEGEAARILGLGCGAALEIHPVLRVLCVRARWGAPSAIHVVLLSAFLGAMWIVEILDYLPFVELDQFGIRPRTVAGLGG
jgi:hypothetical protein